MVEQSISKNRIGQIRSLHQKKFREESRLFIAEGRKVVAELLASGYEVKSLVGTESYLAALDSGTIDRVEEIMVAKEADFLKISALSTPQEVLAVARIPSEDLKVSDFKGKLSVLLDDVRDPGNLGAILRIAHWFGAAQVVTSLNSVDAYNPKVVQASMGSLFHVPVHSIGLEGLLTQIRSETDIPVYAALMEGEDIYSASLTQEGILLFGNESMGIRTSLQELSHRKITIPSSELVTGNRPESLNVAMSAALVLAAFRHHA